MTKTTGRLLVSLILTAILAQTSLRADQTDPASPQTRSEIKTPEQSQPQSPASQPHDANENPASQPPDANENPATEKRHFNWKNEYILSECVSDNGQVNYERLRRKKPALYALLYDYSDLAREEYQSWSEPEQLAFWINAYNIQLLKILSDNYPIESSRFLRLIWGPYSIRHIDRRIDGIDQQKFIIMDEEFTLREIERRIIRDQFNEPRACFALCRGTMGGPPLRPQPYTAEKLDQQLEDQVNRCLKSSAALEVNSADDRVYLSVFLDPDWWGAAFIDKYGIDRKFKDHQPAVRAVLNFLTNHTASDTTQYLETGSYSVNYISYDWTINDIGRR